MTANYFENQETIAKNMILFMREKGYSRLSLSILTSIDRTEIDHILSGENTDESVYVSQINQINQVFKLSDDYLLTTKETNSLPISPIVSSERSELAQEMMDELDDIMDIYSMYIK